MQEDRRDNSELIAQMKDLITPIDDKVNRILKALYENGDHEKGIIAQTALNTNYRETTQKRLTTIIGGILVSALSGRGRLILFILNKSQR